MSARFHAVAGFAIAVVLFSLPQWLKQDAPVFTAHRGASAMHYDEGALYAPGVRRFADTGRPAWELDVYELRSERFAYPVTHQIVLGALARAAGGVGGAFAIAHSLFPALIWLAFFALMLRATQHAPLSSFAAWAALVIAAAPRNAFLLGASAFIQPLEMTRTPHPALSTAILLLALWGLLQCLTRQHALWLWFTGPLFGLLFYTYYFHAVAAWTALGCVLIFSRDAWRRLTIIVVTGLAVATPYLLWTVTSMRSGISRHLMARIGVFERTPDWIGIAGLVVSGFIFVAMAFRRPKNGSASFDVPWLLVALLTGAFVVTNLHLVTGYNAQHEHAYNRLVQPFGLLLAVIAGHRWFGYLLFRPLIDLGTVLVIVLAGCRQTYVASAMPSFARESAAQSQQLRRLDGLDGPLVIGVLDEEIRALLPAFTRHWSFVPVGFRTLASNEEILTRFVIIARLTGVSHDESLGLLKSPPPSGAMRTFCYGLLDDFSVQPADVDRFENLWRKFDDSAELPRSLATRRLDVVLVPSDHAPVQVSGVNLAPLSDAGQWRAFRVTLAEPASGN